MRKTFVIFSGIRVPILPAMVLFIVSVGAIYFSFFGLSSEQKLSVFLRFGYYAVGLSFLLALGFAVRPMWQTLKRIEWRRSDMFALGGLLTVFLVFFVAEPNRFKIVQDEVLLLATSKTLHEVAEPAYPIFGYWFEDEFQNGLMHIDKRPILFPVLVSVVHTIVGFSTATPFLVNNVICFLILLLLYGMTRKVAATLPAFIGVLLFITVPEFVITGNGGGFGSLNLLVILCVLITSTAYLETPRSQTLNALVFTGVLLSQVRSETVVLIFGVCVVVLIGAVRAKRLPLSFWVCLAPVLVSFYVLQKEIYEVRPVLWQELEDGNVMSVGYIWENLRLNLKYFFNVGLSSSNSLALTVLSLIALIGICVRFRQCLDRTWRPDAIIVAGTFFALIALQLVLFHFYYEGDVYSPIKSRYALPLCLFLSIAVGYFLSLSRKRSLWFKGAFLLFASAEILSINLPATLLGRRTDYAYRTNWQNAFAQAHAHEKFLLIGDEEPLIWFVNEQSAVDPVIATKWLPELKYLLELQYFDAVYYFHRTYSDEPISLEARKTLDAVVEVEPYPAGVVGDKVVISKVTAINVDGDHEVGSAVPHNSPMIQADPELRQRILDSFPVWRSK